MPLHNFFEDVGTFFLAMKYVQGRPLQAILDAGRKQDKRIPTNRIVSVAKDVSSALAHAHKQGRAIVHRDIKPSNIMVTPEGRAIVMDFGIAKAIGREKLTRTRGVVGTYEYMSPEQVVGDAVSPASDVYSLGIVL